MLISPPPVLLRFWPRVMVPPYTVREPLTETAALNVIAPVFVELPIVSPLPSVEEVIAVLTVTAKMVVFPTMLSEPLPNAVVIAETFTVEFAVTVKVPELIDHPEAELVPVEIVRV